MSGFNAEAIKQDFPILDQIVNDEPLVYLDNAATTQKPSGCWQRLKTTILETMPTSTACAYASRGATAAYEAARERVRSFYQCSF